MGQQDQTKKYFSKSASAWQDKSGDHDEFSIVRERNRAVLEVIGEHEKPECFLDVGCGTGQLVIAAAQLSIDATGLDFAPEMVEQCKANRQAADVEARFIEASVFDVELGSESYDIISALGFIEYISPEQMMTFFARCFDALRPQGFLVIGTRNRLFNAVTMNAYTELELDLDTYKELVGENIALHKSESQQDAFKKLQDHERAYPQPEQHPGTGIAVETRYQYTPADLIARLRTVGFVPATIFPIHFHGLPMVIKQSDHALHHQLANVMSTVGWRDQRVTPFCSSFVLHVRK